MDIIVRKVGRRFNLNDDIEYELLCYFYNRQGFTTEALRYIARCRRHARITRLRIGLELKVWWNHCVRVSWLHPLRAASGVLYRCASVAPYYRGAYRNRIHELHYVEEAQRDGWVSAVDAAAIHRSCYDGVISFWNYD